MYIFHRMGSRNEHPGATGAGPSSTIGITARLRRKLSAVSYQLPICDKFAGWASWMSFSEPAVPEVQWLSADG
jgi:hypothetical protein